MPELIEISDLKDERLTVYHSLNEAQLKHYYEPEEGIFIAESPKVIERALNAGYQPLSALIEKSMLGHHQSQILERLGDIPVYYAPGEALSGITGFALTRGLLAAMRRRPLPDEEEICRSGSRIAVLEEVVNPTNVGAIFRCAAALGMDAVLLTEGCADPLSRRSERVSMGSVFQVPWTRIKINDNGDSYVKRLHSMGFTTAAMALRKDSVDVDDEVLCSAGKLAVILGTEGEGLLQETIDACDHTLCIPMAHGVDSLNVAAASAIAFWQLGRRKGK